MPDKNKDNSTLQEPKVLDNHRDYQNPDWNIGKIFWGLLFVLIGGLALANNFGFIEVNFVNLWRLWPLFIVAFGLSILSLHNLFGRVIAVILALATIGAVISIMLGNYPNLALHTYSAAIQKASDKVKQVEVSVKAGASSLQIDTVSDNSVAKVKFESNITNLFDTSEVVGSTQQVVLSTNGNKGNGWLMGDERNIWNINLTNNLPLTLNIDDGGSSSNIDMSEAMLSDMSVKSGASSMTIKLGDIQDITNLSIESGVSSIVVKVPSASGIQLKLENGLTSNNLADLIKVGDNKYESSGYSQSKKRINISTKIGLSSFTIERY